MTTALQALFVSLLCLPLLAEAAGPARVGFAVGRVVAVSAEGAERSLAKGAEVVVGETLRTGDAAMVQLRFSDGAMLTLRANSEFRIEEYRFNGAADGSERGFFRLIKGGLRTITGLIGKQSRSSYRMHTAVATVGIRGTEYSLQLSGGADGRLEINTASGAVEVANGAGCLVVSAGGSAVVGGATAPSGTGGTFAPCHEMPDMLPERILVPPAAPLLEPAPPVNRNPMPSTVPSTAPSLTHGH